MSTINRTENSGPSIPLRSAVKTENTWDLSKLFKNDDTWNAGLVEYEIMAEKIPGFRGTLGKTAEALADYLDFSRDFGVLEERLNYYSDLRQTEDEGSGAARTMTGKLMMAAAKAHAAGSWEAPEIQAIPEADMEIFLAHPRMTDYRIYLKKILRHKPHILSDKEERLIALHAEGEGTAVETFSVLTNVDMDFGQVDTPEGKRPLTQSTWTVFMEDPDRDLRRRAYAAFYRRFDSHKTTLASLYAGSVKQDVIQARVRNFSSARAAALFPDNVPETVYDSLIAAVGNNLAPLHRYYQLRKRVLKLPELRHYDVYAPLVPKAAKQTGWNEAVDLISAALAPLGGRVCGNPPVRAPGPLGRPV
jgi:oligoendopeptidase F